VTQRFSHGISFNMNYNYSKSLELMNSPDVFNRSLGKDLGAFDLPHQFRFTVQYQVPRLRDSGNGIFSNKIVSAIVSDWGIGTYLNYQSGPVVARPSSNGSVGIGQFFGPRSWGARLLRLRRAVEKDRRRELHESLVGGLYRLPRPAPYRSARH
jgi:hypothetical protein